jgi:hypothetical protein
MLGLIVSACTIAFVCSGPPARQRPHRPRALPHVTFTHLAATAPG